MRIRIEKAFGISKAGYWHCYLFSFGAGKNGFCLMLLLIAFNVSWGDAVRKQKEEELKNK